MLGLTKVLVASVATILDPFSAFSDVKKHVTRMKIRIIVAQMAQSSKLTCV